MRPMICAFENCGKNIEDYQRGIIRDGKLYHEDCLEPSRVQYRSEDLEKLYNTFPTIEGQVLDDLYMFLVDEGATKLEDFYSLLGAKWAVITRGIEDNSNDGIDIETFTSKIKASKWLANEIWTGMMENYGFEVEYILNNGEIYAIDGQWDIKVSF